MRHIRIVKTKNVSDPKPVDLIYILREKNQKRFWSWVEKKGPDECWIWQGAPNTSGYGVIRISFGKGTKSRLVKAHVFSLMTETGQINKTLALHSIKCTSKLCVNPSHLRWGNKSDNGLDRRELSGDPNQKLDWEKVDHIRTMLGEGYPQNGIALLFGVSQALINLINHNKEWKEESRPSQRLERPLATRRHQTRGESGSERRTGFVRGIAS